MPCPHCRAHQVLRWANVEWPEGEPEWAQYRCEHCSKMIGEHQKAGMLKHGEWRAARPERMVEEAISGMLPKNKLGKQMYRKLNVYAGAKHPHDAQKPVALAVEA